MGIRDSTFMLIFTSGTSGEPKAVQVSHFTVLMAGTALVHRFGITDSDVCYLSMPLFHSNAVLAGWSVAVGAGAAMALGGDRLMAEAESRARRPNLVFVFADQLRAQSVGFMGNRQVQTPNLDAFAAARTLH